MTKVACTALAGLLLAAAAAADTVYLKNGVRFDGVVTPVPDQEGLYKVTAGDRTLFYRESEIREIEKNDRTGKLDREELLARWQEKNKKLTEETGLTAEQRRTVRGLMLALKTEVVAERLAIREKLVGLQAEYDVYGYLASLYPELSILLAPNVLETLYYLDPVRAAALLRESAQSNYYGTRAMAIELLGRSRDREAMALIARGLADHQRPVVISTAYVLAAMNVKEATPALVELLAHPDQRVSNAARESLLTLWGESLGDERPANVDAWKSFWAAQSTSGTPIELAKLEPLSPEEEEFTQSIDTNH